MIAPLGLRLYRSTACTTLPRSLPMSCRRQEVGDCWPCCRMILATLVALPARCGTFPRFRSSRPKSVCSKLRAASCWSCRAKLVNRA